MREKKQCYFYFHANVTNITLDLEHTNNIKYYIIYNTIYNITHDILVGYTLSHNNMCNCQGNLQKKL